jgi:hypothetical protein
VIADEGFGGEEFEALIRDLGARSAAFGGGEREDVATSAEQ